jgi:hypothetical protein
VQSQPFESFQAYDRKIGGNITLKLKWQLLSYTKEEEKEYSLVTNLRSCEELQNLGLPDMHPCFLL